LKQQKTALAKILFIFNISAAGGWLNERDRTFNARHIRIKSGWYRHQHFPGCHLQ
jgi:hypothetical protein